MSLFDRFWRKTETKTEEHSSSTNQNQSDDFNEQVDEEDLDAIMEELQRDGFTPKRPILHMFQHKTLREAVFENHPELMKDLAGGATGESLSYYRGKASMHCNFAGYQEYDFMENDEYMEMEREWFQQVEIHPYRRNGYSVYVFTMPPPESVPEAHFAAIVHKDDESKEFWEVSPSTRYFVLEKSFSNQAVLCEWLRDGSRNNFGKGTAPVEAAFLEDVFQRLPAFRQESNRILLEGPMLELIRMMRPTSTNYHLVCVEFADGTKIKDAKVYRWCELELPIEFINKEITQLSVNADQP